MTLEARALVAGYGSAPPILNGVDLVAREGQVTLVIGPNGAGKSTLLKTIYGYLVPRAGEILHDGRPLAGIPPKDMIRNGIAYLIQGRSTFPEMTVRENLELGAWAVGRDRERVSAALESVYARFPVLAEKRRRLAGMLSGGEQRMLEIARLTMTSPRTLLLDEPSVGLMPRLVDTVYAEIARLKEERYTILMVDQNVKKGIEIADWVYELRLGENGTSGPQAEFRERLPVLVAEWL